MRRRLGALCIPPGAEPPPPPGGGLLSWAPPTLVSPTTINLSSSATVAPRVYKLDSTKDYNLVIPPAGIDIAYDLQFVGGRNIKCIGGDVRFHNDGGGQPTARQFAIIGKKGVTTARTVFLEGVRFRNANGDPMTEGINVISEGEPHIRVVLQNIDLGDISGSEHTWHADSIQVWNGPQFLLVDRMKNSSNYQFLMLQAGKYGQTPARTYAAGQYVFRNCDFRMRADGSEGPYGGYGVYQTNDPKPQLTFDEVYMYGPGMRSNFISNGVAGTPKGTAPPGVIHAAPTVSVLSGNPGSDYVSPGYV